MVSTEEYCFHTMVRLENFKLDHCESGTICIHEDFAKVLIEISSKIIEPSQYI